MAFTLPAGLLAQPYGEIADDAAIGAIESSQPSGTRMLVALGFPFRWPGFEWSADQADWAARAIAGLRSWPELNRVVIPDPDGEPIWWVAYLSSPAWWVWVLAALGLFIAAAIAMRVVWVVTPEPMKGGLEIFGNIIPILVVMLLMSTMAAVLPPLLKEMAPVATEAVKEKLR